MPYSTVIFDTFPWPQFGAITTLRRSRFGVRALGAALAADGKESAPADAGTENESGETSPHSKERQSALKPVATALSSAEIARIEAVAAAGCELRRQWA